MPSNHQQRQWYLSLASVPELDGLNSKARGRVYRELGGQWFNVLVAAPSMLVSGLVLAMFEHRHFAVAAITIGAYLISLAGISVFGIPLWIAKRRPLMRVLADEIQRSLPNGPVSQA